MSKGSESLKKLFDFIEGEFYNCDILKDLYPHKNIIEKDLDRLEKQDKIIKIIKEKEPDISFLVRVEDLNHYNSCVWKEQELTQEEWNLLKEVFK